MRRERLTAVGAKSLEERTIPGGITQLRACLGRRRSWRRAIRTRDRRGAAALEYVLIAPVLFLMFFATADIGVAAWQYVETYETMRGVAAYALYHPPSDVTNPGTWLSAVMPSGMTVTVRCGTGTPPPTCAAGNAANLPKSYWFTQTITVTALVVPGLAGTYTLNYLDRFQ